MSFRIGRKALLKTNLLAMKSHFDSKASLRTKLINLKLPSPPIIPVLIKLVDVTAGLKRGMGCLTI